MPNTPGAFSGITALAGPEFRQWQRWYFQCIARLLVPGGLVLLQIPDRRLGLRGGRNLVRQTLALTRWRLAANLPPSGVKLLLRRLSSSAANYGLLPTKPPEAKFLSAGYIAFQKTESVVTGDKFTDQAFSNLFRDWLGESDTPPLPPSDSLFQASEFKKRFKTTNVAVLSPHPDDELIGCGGTLLELQKAGCKVHVMQMTEGVTCQALRKVAHPNRTKVRCNEAREVASRFGWEVNFNSTGPSGALTADRQTIDKLREWLKALQPSVIFVPASTDLHPEHRLTNAILRIAADEIPMHSLLLEYPVWGFLSEPTVTIDVTDSYETNIDALYIYRTAMKAEDYVNRCRVHSSKFASLIGNGNARWVECFSQLPMESFR